MLIGVLVAGCDAAELNVRFLRSENYAFSASEQRLIGRIAESSTREARGLLPLLPPALEITVRPGTDVLAETGFSATVMPPTGIMITIDTSRQGGVEPAVARWLRPILFHELHHLARGQVVRTRSIVDHAVTEGMAAVFERDLAKSETPWATYGPEVSEWAGEIVALPDEASTSEWIYQHRDGRKWIGMRVGAYWVDQAVARSGRSALDLISMPAADIIGLARK